DFALRLERCGVQVNRSASHCCGFDALLDGHAPLASQHVSGRDDLVLERVIDQIDNLEKRHGRLGDSLEAGLWRRTLKVDRTVEWARAATKYLHVKRQRLRRPRDPDIAEGWIVPANGQGADIGQVRNALGVME